MACSRAPPINYVCALRRKHSPRVRAPRRRASRPAKISAQRRSPLRTAPGLLENYKQALQLLARFAFFAGVGSHTTMGMGQVAQAANRKGQE